MNTFDEIKKSLKTEFDLLDSHITKSIQVDVDIINDLIGYVNLKSGKKIRPTIAILIAKSLNIDLQKTIELAAIIEFIHTATLIHDDVIDESTIRRGKKTANRVFGDKVSVLVGDFLYSLAFKNLGKLENNKLIIELAKATNIIAKGEVIQLINVKNLKITQAEYLDIIYKKTAKLFEMSSSLVLLLNKTQESKVSYLKEFGKNLGIAFQLADDYLDYNSKTKVLGKNIGDDLNEGKLTLPMIYALEKSNSADKKILTDALKNDKQLVEKDFIAIKNILEKSNALLQTKNLAKNYAQKAMKSIENFKSSKEKEALLELCKFSYQRNS